MILAADNGYSFLIALCGALGLAATGWFSWRASRNTRATRKEIESPNGTRTGESIYQLQKDMVGVLNAQAEQTALGQEARKTQGEILAKLDEHGARDDARFAALFESTGIDDPTT